MARKKLYEFNALVNCNVVIAANSEAEARKEIETYERAWFETGDFICVQDVDLFDIREPDDQDEDTLNDLAHVVVYHTKVE